MEKRLRCYIAFIKSKNIMGMMEEEKSTLRSEMLVQIAFFQHERFIHLIVTVTFAVLTMISFLGCFVWAGISFFLLTGLFMALLIPYIRHYYILENGVQKLYEYYDCLQHSI